MNAVRWLTGRSDRRCRRVAQLAAAAVLVAGCATIAGAAPEGSTAGWQIAVAEDSPSSAEVIAPEENSPRAVPEEGASGPQVAAPENGSSMPPAAPPAENPPAAEAAASADRPSGSQVTPPRLGYVQGEVLFWRPGNGDWEPAQVNLPLAEGDALATRSGKLELQVGSETFVRAGGDTQLRLKSNEPGFLQVDVTSGHVSVDVRELRRGDAIDISTANGSAHIAHDGYYRIDVAPGSTRVAVHRGGRATVTASGGGNAEVATGDAVDLSASGDARLTAAAAPPLDDLDTWNYSRDERFLAAPRSYGQAEMYGMDDLDRNGDWRTVETYGRVWVPSSVPAGWAPYSDGRWIWDPLYGYSWVDYAPWGWAPYHYGRWVYPGYWAWAPGPYVAAPVYSPALVAFFGGPGVSVGIGFPFVSWVALGWGEPLFPWWGPVGFIGYPCWWGWGGPHWWGGSHWGYWNGNWNGNWGGQHWNGQNWGGQQWTGHNGGPGWHGAQGQQAMNGFRNAMVRGAVVSTPRDQFGSRSAGNVRLSQVNAQQMRHIQGALPVSARGVPAGAGGKMSVPSLPAQRAANPVQARADFSRSAASFGAAQRAPGATSPGSPAHSAALDAAHRAGPGALTAPQQSGPNAAAFHSSGPQRGSAPPPLPSSARNTTSGFGASPGQARGAAAQRTFSDSFARVHTQPPAMNQFTNARAGGSTNMAGAAAHSMSPPPVPRRFASAGNNSWGGSSSFNSHYAGPTSHMSPPSYASAPSHMSAPTHMNVPAPSMARVSAPAMSHQSMGHGSMGGASFGGGHASFGGFGHAGGGIHGGGGGHR